MSRYRNLPHIDAINDTTAVVEWRLAGAIICIAIAAIALAVLVMT